MRMKKWQRGMSPISVLVVGGLLGFVLLIGFRAVPAVNEYFAIQRIIKKVADEGDGGASIADMRRSFERRGQIDDVVTVTGADLEIRKDGSKVAIDVEYSRKVPVVSNVSLLIDFKATTTGR
ncbi:DUF4845 domain-containing protein [Aromatoleum toluclasticum]|uniref:DUF4845 domain-containing protein n=1 Tax=Aromatoleum toluclasticum TaxID=92003 RepID=UPI001D17D4BA|nr:DUF4845 domain-containing protein [Aromatoleum toluclasticum]MCC4117821.1 DUF4845 domain-containing protein [Aromatoleum toluclasticum]